MKKVKAELLIFAGFVLILTGTIVLEKPFIIRTYEKAAAFGLLCDTAMSGDTGPGRNDPNDALRGENAADSSELVKARRYNMSICKTQSRCGFIYEDTYTDPDYDKILNGPHGMMCVIEIPSINVLLPVGHGTGTDLLRDAAGHMHGTSLPIGGPSTHAVIAAHSGLPDRELFTHLPQIHKGDEFNIYVLGEKHTYRVDQILTCLPSETEALSVIEDEDMVTLMTCVPYGINSHRLFVRGTRCVSEETSSAPDLRNARRREYARSVLSISSMFFVSAVETAFYAVHLHKVMTGFKYRVRDFARDAGQPPPG